MNENNFIDSLVQTASFTFFIKNEDNGKLVLRPELDRIPEIVALKRATRTVHEATRQLQYAALYLDNTLHPSVTSRKRKELIASLCKFDSYNDIHPTTERVIELFKEATNTLDDRASQSLKDTLSTSINFLDKLRDRVEEFNETLETIDTRNFTQEKAMELDLLVAKAESNFKVIIDTVKSICSLQKLISTKEKEEEKEAKLSGNTQKTSLSKMFDN